MRNVIVGTAGHVDHGKTCLIKALTGIDTDRLAEEKKRGITIELGFAGLPNDEGMRIGIIDVPGHEKFIRNMLAGIGGIDLVLLVIAMDEGVMPQTVEHFEILNMLGIRKGIIVLTKTDLVDEEWAGMVEEDTKRLVSGSFLEEAPMIRVSAQTGENIGRLKQRILDEVRGIEEKREDGELFRLPVDRVFTVEGFGTVVTGTLLEGSCHVGQELMLYPEERLLRIRGIESHGNREETASAGQRTALNLTGIKKEEIRRGSLLAAPGSIIPGAMADVKIRLFSTTDRRLKNGDRVHISYGAAQTVCKVVLLSLNELAGGEEAYAQLRFDGPVAVKRGDRFIIRFYSPVETFGGGVVLEAAAAKHRRFREEVLETLRKKETGTEEEAAEAGIREFGSRFPEKQELAVRMNTTVSHVDTILERLKKQKKILVLSGTYCIHREYWEKTVRLAEQELTQFHRENSVLQGMEREEFKSRLGQELHLPPKIREEILKELIKRKVITAADRTVALAGFAAGYSGENETIKGELIELYRQAGWEVPSNDEAAGRFRDKKQARRIMAELTRTGELIKVNPDAYMAPEHWNRALEILHRHFREKGEITLAVYRDLLGTSRKYSVMLLDAFDQRKITKKNGDVRIPR